MILDDINKLIQITEDTTISDDILKKMGGAAVKGAKWVAEKGENLATRFGGIFQRGLTPEVSSAGKVGEAIGTLANTTVGKGAKYGIAGGLGLAGLGILGGAYKVGHAMAPGPYPVNNLIPSGVPTLIGGAALGAAGAYGLHKYHKNKTKNEI